MTDKSETVSRAWHEQEMRYLKGEIAALERQVEMARYIQQVAEWALTGVVTANAKIQFTQQAALRPEEITQAADVISKRMAWEMLNQAKLAFDGFADLHALEQHVRYMENHAGGQGVKFAPFSECASTAIPSTYDRPKPFAGPFRT